MGAEISLRFVGFFDGFGDPFNRSGELFQGGLDAFKACRNAAKKFVLKIGFGSAHGKKSKG